MGREESAAVGLGMSGRGAVDFIVASIALQAGLFVQGAHDPHVATLFSALVITSIAATVVTPPLLRSVARRLPPAGRD